MPSTAELPHSARVRRRTCFHAVAHANEVFETRLARHRGHSCGGPRRLRTRPRPRNGHSSPIAARPHAARQRRVGRRQNSFDARVPQYRSREAARPAIPVSTGLVTAVCAAQFLLEAIDSLEHPFLQGERRQRATIADSLLRWRVPADLAEQLREEPDTAARNVIVGRIADHLVVQPEFEQVDVDLLSAFILLASNDGVVAARVSDICAAIRSATMTANSSAEFPPATDDHAPLRMITGLGKIIAAKANALVLLVDQLEDVWTGRRSQAVQTGHWMCFPANHGARSRLRRRHLRQWRLLVRLRDELAKPLLDRLKDDIRQSHRRGRSASRAARLDPPPRALRATRRSTA